MYKIVSVTLAFCPHANGLFVQSACRKSNIDDEVFDWLNEVKKRASCAART